MDRWCERGILGLVLAILVVGPLAIGAVRPSGFLLVQGLTSGVMVLWGVRFWSAGRAQLFWPPICWVVVAFTLYAVARYLTADIEYVARQELLRVLVYAFLFFATLNNLNRQESAQVISFTLLFLAMAISFYAIYQFLTGSDRVWQFIKPYPHRGSGTYICPNHLAGFLEMLLPLGLAYTLCGRVRPVLRVFLGYASLVILAGLAVTVSRGGWFSAALALLVLFGVLLFQRNHRLSAFVFLTLLVGVGVLVFPKSEVFRSRTGPLVAHNGKINDELRFSIWGPAVRLWRENPWWGVGPAHFDYRFHAYRPDEVQERPDRVHNDYLNTLVDWGVAGTALVSLAWLLLGAGLLKTWGYVRPPPNDLGGTRGSNRFAFVLGASAGLLALLCHSTVDFNMQIPANAILAITLMALLSAHLRFATERYWVKLALVAKMLGSGVLVVGVYYLSQQGLRRGVEYTWQQRAARAPNFSATQSACLQRAFAAEPKNAATAYKIGECYRIQSQDGGDNYRELAGRAMEWFARATKLNPWDDQSYLRYGWCLDWVGRQDESGPYFHRAAELDPNGFFTLANVGLHYVELKDYAAAIPWFERSLRLENNNNPIARSYLQIANRTLLEAATNDISAHLQ
ncbi:O-antigen polymerase [Verrucomicrobia bacterium]|nr:O-antigen polymerase [Verrucomicrobiota bacterium]